MKTRWLTACLVSALLISAILSQNFMNTVAQENSPDVYFGVYIAYGGITQAEALIDRVSSFTNLFVVGTTPIAWTFDENKTFAYAYDKGLNFMSLTASLGPDWYKFANDTWGAYGKGFFSVDEPGGHALDKPSTSVVGWNNSTLPASPAQAANIFEATVGARLNSTRNARFSLASYPLFTSDYGLYWFDYKAGYDGLFAEFAANYSRQMTVALIRGAAAVQNKDWGVMIHWKYDVPPYLESGQDLYNDLIYAYNAGAKYIVIYDANEGWTQDILAPEHIQAMQQFWEYAQNNPRQSHPVSERAALVLPDAYGCGFRWPGEKIWGIWPQDANSATINTAIGSQLRVYGDKLDIIYDDGLTPGNNYGYSQLLYWNDPNLQPTPSPSPTPPPTPKPSPTLTPSPTSSLFPSPTATPTLTPTQTPTPSVSPFENPTGTPKQTPRGLGSYDFVIEVTLVVSVAIVSVIAFAFIRKRKPN